MDIEGKIEEVNQRVYGGEMPAQNRAVMRAILKREERAEEKWGEFCNADIIRGYDDGEWLEHKQSYEFSTT